MAQQTKPSDFLQELWADIADLPREKHSGVEAALELMEQIGGKPHADFVERIYDVLMETPETSVYCHQIMWSRIITSTEWIRDHLINDESVLDVGSCTGHQVLYWAKELPHSQFTGIDISANAINVANQWKDELDLGNAEFRVDDYLRTDFDEGTDVFDAIINCFTMETLPEHLSSRCNLPDWMLKSLKEDGRLIAVLTVENWIVLGQIIDQWRSQGFRLNEIAMIPTGDGATHPGLVMSRIGNDMLLDIREWAFRTIAEQGNGLWMLRNPVDEHGNSGANPFEYTFEDLTPIDNQIQYPMRIETWVADAPKIHPDSLPASPYQPVIELRHPDWEMDGYPLAVWMDWYERDGEPQSRYRIVFHEYPEITKELRKKLEYLNAKKSDLLDADLSEDEEPYAKLASFIEQI